MVSLPLSLRNTIAYFAKYDYPLTPSELWFWQHGSSFSKLKIEKLFTKLRIENWKLRKQREVYSRKKWAIAKRMGNQLKLFPTITAVLVTGALAMNNCPQGDDIDFMIVTYPNTLWITRFFVNLFLNSLRRHPGDKNAPNKICPNLWLDIRNLKLEIRNLRVAHEILQAKVLWDRTGVHAQFLHANSWVKKYLPIAYKYLSPGPSPVTGEGNARGEVFWKFQNLIFFVIQYLYMKPKMTSERIGPGFAFFHPKPQTS